MSAAPDWKELTGRTLDCCSDISRSSEEPGQITRTFLSPPMKAVHARLDTWAAALALPTHLDAAGNWHAVRRSQSPSARTLIIGSHLDSVPNAGPYDGILGVVAGLALLEALGSTPLPYHIRVVGFSEEEGVRFGVPFIGSRALIGTADELLEGVDAGGVSVAQAITEYGLDVNELPAAQVRDDVLGYFELHIEQGPVLEAGHLALAPVSAIVGQSRLEVRFSGKANHAGTTPMRLRRDALTGASALILAAETLARHLPGLVATVGALTALPGASNVIPAEVSLPLDIRHAADEVRLWAQGELLAEGERIAQQRGLTFRHESRLDKTATPMDAGLTGLLGRALNDEGHGTPPMLSGAGHDAGVLGHVWPAAMLFVRSPGGLSHHPDETVLPGDVEAALRVGLRFLHLLAEQEDNRG